MTTIIKDETLTAIGNAIREKTGKANKLTPAEMVTEIAGITTGGEDVLTEYFTDTLTTFKSETLTEVPYSAFMGKKSLKTIVLPNCKHLGDNAFRLCTALEMAELPPKTKIIGVSAFSQDPGVKIKKIILPTTIGTSSFYECTGLTKLYVKIGPYPGLVQIGDGAFGKCTNLTDVYMDVGFDFWTGTPFPTTTTIHYGVTEAEFDEILAAGGTE